LMLREDALRFTRLRDSEGLCRLHRYRGLRLRSGTAHTPLEILLRSLGGGSLVFLPFLDLRQRLDTGRTLAGYRVAVNDDAADCPWPDVATYVLVRLSRLPKLDLKGLNET
jgi:hypothetical protein